MNQSTILSWITFIPLIGMGAILLVPRRNLSLIKMICWVATFIPLVLVTWLYFAGFEKRYDASVQDKFVDGYQCVQKVGWIPSIGVYYHVGIDGLSLPLVWLTALLLFVAVPASETVHRAGKAYYAC